MAWLDSFFKMGAQDLWGGMRQPGVQPPGTAFDDPMRGMGIFDRLKYMQQENPGALMALGAGMMDGDMSRGFRDMAALTALHRRERKEEVAGQRKANATRTWLMRQHGMSADDADGIIAAGAVGDWMKPAEGPKLTDDQREYQAAVEQGFDGTFMDFMIRMREAGRSQVNVDTGVKLPSGYQWNDPADQSKGVSPIPGGPAEQIPGELAARVGLADQFIEKAPTIRQQLAAGEASGPIDVWNARNNQSSPQARVHRELEYGVEALVRLLTGAGMNMAEAEERARRYLPTYTDNAASMTQKLDSLVEYLRSTKDMALRGRGGSAPAPASSAGASTTQTGVQWRVK